MSNKWISVVRSPINRVLNLVGFEMRRRMPPRDAMADLHHLIEMPIEHCVDVRGRSFAPWGNNHWVQCLQQYIKDGRDVLDTSVLYKYYRDYTSQCFQDEIFRYVKEGTIARGKLFRCPEFYVLPWMPPSKIESNLRRIHDYLKEDPDLRTKILSDYWGPQPKDFIKREIDVSINAFESIKMNGFCPEMYRDKYDRFPYPWGVLLKKKYDLRFIIMSGKHKLAALAVMGKRRVELMFPPQYENNRYNIPCVLDLDNIKRWSCVRMGVYDETQARLIMETYFDAS